MGKRIVWPTAVSGARDLLAVVGLAVCVFALAAIRGGGAPGAARDPGITLILFLCMMTSCLGVLLSLSAELRTRKVCDDLLSIATSREEFEATLRLVDGAFHGKGSYVCGAVLSLLGCGAVVHMSPGYDRVTNLAIYVLVLLGFYVAGRGLWIAFSTSLWVRRIGRIEAFDFFILPGRTYALRHLAHLFAHLSVSFSLEVLVFCTVFFSTDLDNASARYAYMHIMVVPFIAFTVFYIWWPQSILHRIVRSSKETRLLSIEKVVKRSIGGIDEDDFESMGAINALVDLHAKIVASPDRVIDFAMVGKFATAVLIPTVVALSEHPNLIDAFRGFLVSALG